MKKSELIQMIREEIIKEVSEDDDPKFLFQGINTSLLVKIVNNKIDPNSLAKRELADRGLDKKGKWVGFDNAAKIHGVK